jgi:hypothetical protein
MTVSPGANAGMVFVQASNFFLLKGLDEVHGFLRSIVSRCTKGREFKRLGSPGGRQRIEKPLIIA